MKIPRMMSTDRVRAYLDMDAGEARFALFRPDEPGQWKEMPGKITGILSPVCAAACMQDRCSVSLGETSKMSAHELAKESAHPEEKAKRPKVDKYAHIQSKFLSDARLNPISNVLRQLGAFQAHELEPAVALLDEETPIKKLFMLLEMARHGGGGAASADGNIPLDRWITCMEDLAG